MVRLQKIFLTVGLGALLSVSFQNCSPNVNFDAENDIQASAVSALDPNLELEDRIVEISNSADYMENQNYVAYATLGSVATPDSTSVGDEVYETKSGFFNIVYK